MDGRSDTKFSKGVDHALQYALPVYLPVIGGVALIALKPTLWFSVVQAIVIWVSAVLLVPLLSERYGIPFLPVSKVWRGICLIAYAVPFICVMIFEAFRIPPLSTHYLFVIGLGLAFLVATGIHRFVSDNRNTSEDRNRDARLLSWRGAYRPICIVFVWIPTCLVAPSFVLLEGLLTMMRTPQIRETFADSTAETRRDHKFSFWPGAAAGPVEFLHLSDTHFTDLSEMTAEGEPSGNAAFPAYSQRIERVQPRLVFITGDITDNGTPEQWNRAYNALKGIAAKANVIMAPGNHDLTFAYTSNPFRLKPTARLRLLRFLDLQASLDEVRRTADTHSQRVFSTLEGQDYFLSSLMKDLRPSIENLSNRPPGLEGLDEEDVVAKLADLLKSDLLKTILKTPQDLFPLQWRSSDGATHILVLNSFSTIEDDLGRSAIGAFGPDQLNRVRLSLAHDASQLAVQTIYFLCHHPIGRAPHYGVRTIWDYGTLQLEPEDSTSLLDHVWEIRKARKDIKWLACYGHRHERHYGILEGIEMLEAPNIGGDTKGFWVGYRGGDLLLVGWSPITGN